VHRLSLNLRHSSLLNTAFEAVERKGPEKVIKPSSRSAFGFAMFGSFLAFAFLSTESGSSQNTSDKPASQGWYAIALKNRDFGESDEIPTVLNLSSRIHVQVSSCTFLSLFSPRSSSVGAIQIRLGSEGWIDFSDIRVASTTGNNSGAFDFYASLITLKRICFSKCKSFGGAAALSATNNDHSGSLMINITDTSIMSCIGLTCFHVRHLCGFYEKGNFSTCHCEGGNIAHFDSERECR
jgi:hypothetical protein